MTFKVIKAGLVSLMLSVSGFANANIILFEWESSVVDQSIVWTLDTLREPDGGGGFAGYGIDYTFGEVGTELFKGRFEAWHARAGGGMRLRLNNDRDEWIGVLGAQLYTGDTQAPVFVAGDYLLYDDSAGTLLNGSLKISEVTEVPEPTALAILALGIIGLATRRFIKQS